MNTRSTVAALVVVSLLLAVYGAGQVGAGVISYVKLDPLTADADSGISPSKFYTHLLDMGTGTAATVNGAAFTQMPLASIDAAPDFSYTVNSGTRNNHGGGNNPGVDVGQGMYDVMWDFVYNGGTAPGGIATMTLSRLIPGHQYETRIYNRSWTPLAERIATFDFDTDGDGVPEDTIPLINQDDASLTPPSDGTYLTETAYALSYQFTADSDTETISITHQGAENYSWHIYGVTNEELGVNVLSWDGEGSGLWNSTTQWEGGDPGDYPTLHTVTTVPSNTVTVTEPAKARSLEVIDGGGIAVGDDMSLTVAYEASFAPGTTLTTGARTTLSAASGSIPVIESGGDTTIEVVYEELTAAGYTDGGGAPRVFTKTGDGTLILDNNNGTNVVAGSTAIRVEEGILDVQGADPLGGSTAVTLAGGELIVRAGAELIKDISTGFDNASGIVIDGGMPDPDYGIMPDSVTATVLLEEWPVGDPWLANSDTSKWIGFDTASSEVPPGDYDFNTTVTLDGKNGPAPVLWGGWTTDNAGLDVLINGISTGIRIDGTEGFDVLHPLGPVGEGLFQQGLNTITFQLNNVGTVDSPAGLRVDAGVYNVEASDLSAVTMTVDGGGTLDLQSPWAADVGPLVMKAGALRTTGMVPSVTFDGTTIDPAATAVGFDPRVPTEYRTITNNSTQPEVIISKVGPGTWHLDGPVSGTTSNISWRVEDGTFIVRGENALSGRPVTIAGGTLDTVGETSLDGAAIELAGGLLRVEGVPGDPADAPTGAIAHYAFESAVGGVTPNTGSAGAVLDGVLRGDPALTTRGGGRIGEAMQFNGAGYVEVLYDAPSLGNLNTFTVSAWVNLDSEPPDFPLVDEYGIMGTRIASDGTGTGGDTFDVKAAGNMIHGDVGMGDTGWINTNVDIRAEDTGSTSQGGDIAIDEWHLVTYVIDDASKQFRLYLDGDLKQTMDYDAGQTPLLMDFDQKLWIGDDYYDYEPMDGRIDEVYVYGRALDTGEVETLWGGGFGPNDGTGGLDMSNTDLLVTADSTLSAVHGAVGGGPAPFGQLTLSQGVLTTTGTAGAVAFAGISVDPAGEAPYAVGLDTLVPTDPAVIDVVNTVDPITFSKSGPADLVLTAANVGANGFGNVTFDVREGRLVGVQAPAKASGPFDEAVLQLSDGELLLAGSTTDAPVQFDNTLTVATSGTVTAGPGGTGTTGVAVTLGSATNGVLLDGNSLALRSSSADGYTLRVLGEFLSGDGSISVAEGDVTLSGGGSVGSVDATGGALSIAGADLNVGTMTVLESALVGTGTNRVIVGESLAVGGATYSVEGADSFSVSGDDILAEANILLDGGVITVSAAGAPAGAVAHYSFDEGSAGSPSAQDSAGSNHGTVNGATWVPGHVGLGALAFDPGVGAHVEVPYDAALDLSEYTVSMWANVAVDPAGTWLGLLGARNHGADGTFDLKVMETSIHGDVGLGGGAWINTDVDITAGNVGSTGQGGDIPPLEWHMITYVIDNANKQYELYLDADLKVTMPFADPGATPRFMMPANVVQIGNDYEDPAGAGQHWMNGMIDDVYIYGRAISAPEVVTLYGTGSGPIGGGINMPGHNLVVSVPTTLHGDTSEEALFGNLTVLSGATLTITGAPSISVADLTTPESTTIQGGGVTVRGNLNVGGSTGLLSVVPASNRSFEFLEDNEETPENDGATYNCEIGEWDSEHVVDPWDPVPGAGPVNDKVHSRGDVLLGGTLELIALGKLSPAQPLPENPDVMVQWYGDQTRTIIDSVGEATIRWTFQWVPERQPEQWYIQDVVDPDTGEILQARNWDQGHLGYGVFLTRQGDGGANTEYPPDPPHYGLSYAANTTQAHLFQAADGDTNGDRNLNSLDIQNILSLNKYLTGEPANWIEGNFNAHDPEGAGRDVCDSKDIQLILATALWNTPQPYSEPPDGKLVEAEDGAELILTPGEGGQWNVQIDSHGLPLTSYVIHSADGIFTGRPAANLGMFQQDDDFMIGGVGFGTLIEGVHELGDVIRGTEGLENLSLSYTVEGAAGLYEGRVSVVPEPGTLMMLVCGVLGLLLWRRRRRTE